MSCDFCKKEVSIESGTFDFYIDEEGDFCAYFDNENRYGDTYNTYIKIFYCPICGDKIEKR